MKLEILMTAAQLRDASDYLVGEWSDARLAESSVRGSGRQLVWERLEWMELLNPHRGDFPMGWMLRDELGAVAGVHLVLWHRFRGADGTSVPVAVSHNYYVSESHRGLPGLSLFQKFWALKKNARLICLTAGANSAEFWRRFGASPLDGYATEWIKVWKPGPLVEEALLRRRVPGALASLARLLPFRFGSGGSCRLQLRIVSFEEMERCAEEMSLHPAATGRVEFSAEYLRWRYSMPGDGALQLWEVVFPEGQKAWVGVRQRRRGIRQQVKTLQILDWVVSETILPEALEAVAFRAADGAAMCQIRGIPSTAAGLAAKGFKLRTLPACIAWDSSALGGLHIREADGDGGCYGLVAPS